MNVRSEGPCPALGPLPPWQGVHHGKRWDGGRGCGPHCTSPFGTEKQLEVSVFTGDKFHFTNFLKFRHGHVLMYKYKKPPRVFLSREDSLPQKNSLSTYLARSGAGRNS